MSVISRSHRWASPFAGACLCVAVAVSSAAAQSTKDTAKRSGGLRLPRCKPGEGTDLGTFRSIINQNLSAFTGSRNAGMPGRFVGIDLRDGTASTTHTFSGGGRGIVALNVNGGANEGVMALFGGGRLSPRIGASGTWHFLRGPKSIDFETASCNRLNEVATRADMAFALRIGDIETGALSVQRRAERANLTQRARVLDSMVKALVSPTTDAERLRNDSLRMEHRRATIRLAWLDSVPLPDDLAQQNEAIRVGRKAFDEARAQLDVRGVSLSWWSVGVSAQNVRFDLYDGTLPAARQFAAQSVYHRSALVSYTKLRHSGFSRESYYASVAVRAGWESTFGDLSRRELIDRTQITPPPAERYTERKRTVYQGVLDTDVSTVRITADYYDFVSRSFAIHLFPGFAARNGRPSEVSSGVGVLLSSRKPDAPASTSNLEVFYEVPDLTNTRNASAQLWKRGLVGLRFAFPLGIPKGG